jgi:hypothetical protein
MNRGQREGTLSPLSTSNPGKFFDERSPIAYCTLVNSSV